MGMNVGSDADDDVPISDINVVPFTDVRTHLGFGKLTHRALQQLLLFGQIKI